MTRLADDHGEQSGPRCQCPSAWSELTLFPSPLARSQWVLNKIQVRPLTSHTAEAWLELTRTHLHRFPCSSSSASWASPSSSCSFAHSSVRPVCFLHPNQLELMRKFANRLHEAPTNRRDCLQRTVAPNRVQRSRPRLQHLLPACAPSPPWSAPAPPADPISVSQNMSTPPST